MPLKTPGIFGEFTYILTFLFTIKITTKFFVANTSVPAMCVDYKTYPKEIVKLKLTICL